MNLPPLPLIDGCLFVDNSMLELLTTCPRALEYNKLHQRISSADKPSLNFGSAIHLALEYRYKTYRNAAPDLYCEEEQSNILTKFFDEHPTPVDDWRTLNWAIEVIKRYNQRWALEPFNLLVNDKDEPLVELSFALPLFEWQGRMPKTAVGDLNHCRVQLIDLGPDHVRVVVPVIYTGRIDLPVKWDDQLFIGDHKTTGMLGKEFFGRMKMSAQQKGYAWVWQELTKQKVTGYFINAIRTKEPPKYVVEGKPDYKGKVLSPAKWWEESLVRERYFLNPGELDEWKSNTIKLVEEFFWHYSNDYMPMKTAWCMVFGRCPYFDVCSLAKQDRGLMLSSGLFTTNTWSPLKQPTQSKQ